MANLVGTSGMCEVIARRERAGEVLQFALVQRDEGALILCRSEGEQTQEVFDAPWHVSCVFVDPENCVRLSGVLAGPFAGDDPSLLGVLQSVFGNESVQFSDLLDLMDAAGVPYEYRAFVPHVGVLRPKSAA